MGKKVIIWTFGIENVYSGHGLVAGIQVQMSFWARIFAEKGWKVFSFSNCHVKEEYYGIEFINYHYKSRIVAKVHLGMLFELWQQFSMLIKHKPNVIICRGASRSLYLLSILCKLFNTKLVFFGASDMDFLPWKERIAGLAINALLYQKAIRHISFIVAQNKFQHDALSTYYGKESIIIPNIWMSNVNVHGEIIYDGVWVANLRRLKRVEWFFELAKKNPLKKFAIAGGALDKEYYKSIKETAANISNINFLGPLSYTEVNRLMSESRILVCTSEYEGFPNTFLQAWAHGIPIISTVNPNSVLSEYQIGEHVSSFDELNDRFSRLLMDSSRYSQLRHNIYNYFNANHNAERAYERVLSYLDI